MTTLTTTTTALILFTTTLIVLAAGALAQENTQIKLQKSILDQPLIESSNPELTSSFATDLGSPGYKSPGTARLYSFLLTGAGQFYNGETTKGLLQLAMSVTGIYLFATNIPGEEWVRDEYYWASYGYWRSYGNETLAYGGLALALGASVWSIIDAGGGAHRVNQRNGLALCPTGNEDVQVSLTGMKVFGKTSPGVQVSLTF